jgi:lysophospholipase L1-like esterase
MKFSLLVVLLLVFITNGFSQKIKIQDTVRFLALGDSYTIGQSVGVSERWPNQFAAELTNQGYSVEEVNIIAQTGWTTANLKNAINQQQPSGYNLVSLLIGVNNQFLGGDLQNYATQFEELMQQAIYLAGNNPQHVFVLSIPDYAFTPYGNGNSSISAQIDAFNAVNKQITESYKVKYVNITPISRNGLIQPELVASDGLHPSGIMYGYWVMEIMKSVEMELDINYAPANNHEISCILSQRNLTITSAEKEGEIAIYDSNGKLIKSHFIPKGSGTVLNLNGLADGIYLLMIRDRHKVIYKTKIALL